MWENLQLQKIMGHPCHLLATSEVQNLNKGEVPLLFQPFNLPSNQEVHYFAPLDIFNPLLNFNALKHNVQGSMKLTYPDHYIHMAWFCPVNNTTVTVKLKQVKLQKFWGSSNLG
jgi:hypothetical protein